MDWFNLARAVLIVVVIASVIAAVVTAVAVMNEGRNGLSGGQAKWADNAPQFAVSELLGAMLPSQGEGGSISGLTALFMAMGTAAVAVSVAVWALHWLRNL